MSNETTTVSQFTAQWSNPSDVMSLLLIIGGDIIQTALAQTTGSRITPVCFSFGWVAYSFSTLVRVLGDGRLLPMPDFPTKVFNLESSYVRDNKNWVVGRILRDNELFMNKIEQHAGAGIRIAIYTADPRPADRETTNVYSEIIWLGVTLVQLGVAAIPWGRNGEWGIFLITASGVCAAIMAGSLPQWRIEKIPIRKRSSKYIALTSGNGSRDIMVIYGAKVALDLEELAASESPRCDRVWESVKIFSEPVRTKEGMQRRRTDGSEIRRTHMFKGLPRGLWLTRVASFVQVIFWLALLITVTGLKSHTWYLVGVGSLGMLQNAMLAAAARRPERRGLPLTLVDTIVTNNVMDGLMDLEATISGAGQVLRDEFFPGSLRESEYYWWAGIGQKPMNLELMGEYDSKRVDDYHRGPARSRLPRKHDLNIPGIDFSATKTLPRRSSTTMSTIMEMSSYESNLPTQPERVVEGKPPSARDEYQPMRPYRDAMSPRTFQGTYSGNIARSPDFV